MKLSVSLELVWQLAAREAIAGEFAEIEPEHMFMAVLKFSEMPSQGMANLGIAPEVATLLSSDVEAVRQELESCSIDSTQVRRKLRTLLGKGGAPYSGGAMHRSPDSRTLFTTAATLAAETRSSTMTAVHILKALTATPTARIAQTINTSPQPPNRPPLALPQINALGRDLCAPAASSKDMTASRETRQAECRALLQALGQQGRKSILLLTDQDQTAMDVVVAAAQAIATKKAPQPLQKRRLIDVSTLADWLSTEKRQAITKLFAETSSAPEVILYLPPIPFQDHPAAWSDCDAFLKSYWKDGSVQCISRMGPESYERLIKKDKSWKQMVEVLYIRDTTQETLPQEL